MLFVWIDASHLLNNLIEAGSLSRVLPQVKFMEANYEVSSKSSTETYSATSLIQDLILVTSYLCSNVFESSRNIDSAASVSSDASVASAKSHSRGNSVTATLIALAPFWAIASLITQMKEHPSDSLVLKSALSMLLCTPLTVSAATEMSENCLTRLTATENHFLSSMAANASGVPQFSHQYLHQQLHVLQQQYQDCLFLRLTARLRQSLRTHLSHPLVFALVLSMSLRNDVAVKALMAMTTAPEKLPFFEKVLSRSDENSLDLITSIVTSAPKLVLRPDSSSQHTTPLIYAVAHRSVVSGESYESVLSSQDFVQSIVQILTDYVPSSVTISNHKGMYPLHFAARRGYSSVMLYLASRFGSFSLSLLDNAGKYPLHHALLSSHMHKEDDIVALASLSPQLLDESHSTLYDAPQSGSIAFKLLHYAKKVSPRLFERLSDVLSQWQEEQRSMLYPIPSLLAYTSVLDGSSSASATSSIPASSSLSSDDEEDEDDDEEDGETPMPSSSSKPTSSSAASIAASSLHFFAQSLLMLQHASPAQYESDSNDTSDFISPVAATKQPAASRKRSRTESDDNNKTTTHTSSHQKKHRRSLVPSSESMDHGDGLTSGDSSVVSALSP